MPIPGENYILRLKETRASLQRLKVLDVCSDLVETLVLAAYSHGGASTNFAGLLLMRVNPLGVVVFKKSFTLCFDGFCGVLDIEQAAFTRAPNGVIVAGTGIHINDGKPHMFAARINDAGTVLWVRRYNHINPLPETLLPGHISSITTLGEPERYLIGANSEEDAWFFQIDGNGVIKRTDRFDSGRVMRLRTSGRQVLAAGDTRHITSVDGWIQSFDRMTGVPGWSRRYRIVEPDGVTWSDVAEGAGSIMLIGQRTRGITIELEAHVAFVDPMNGDLQWARTLRDPDKKPVRVRTVVNRQDEIVPLAGGPVTSTFAVAGEIGIDPWLFMIGEDRTVAFQKRLRTADGTTASRSHGIVWPSYEDLVVGGATGGSVQRGFIESTSVTNGRGFANCSMETNVQFVDTDLREVGDGMSMLPLTIDSSSLDSEQGPDVNATRGCLDAQQ
ncbi:MAG: hypothetical protein ACTHQM_08570 [Thermoanaerobaculia bacterium]